MDRYQSLAEKPYESEYLLHEAIVECPVAQLWPHLLNIGGWMSAHRLEPLDGEAGQVGFFERVHPKSLPQDTPEPHYHLYGIAEILPHKCVALEVFPEAGGSYGSKAKKTSFDTILLTDLGERTHLSFLMIDVLLHKADGGTIHTEDKAARERRLKAVLDGYFDNLRSLIFADAGQRGTQ